MLKPILPPNALRQRIKDQLLYVPKSGILIWVKSIARHISAGSIAGNNRKDGYLRINFRHDKRQYTLYGHHIAWFLKTAKWPKYNIDHKDGNPANNKWRNLRQDKFSQNNQNKNNLSSTNTSGVLGVHLNKYGSYIVQISDQGKTIHLGSFSSLKLATKVRRKAEIKYYGKFAPVRDHA